MKTQSSRNMACGRSSLRAGLHALLAVAMIAAAPAAWPETQPGAASDQGTAGAGKKSETKKKTPSAQEQRDAILKMRDVTLADLYKLKPEVKQEVEKAAGYAVFDASSVYAVLFVGIRGHGVLMDNSTGKPVYMKMTRAGTGPGVGYRKYRVVFVFKSKALLDQFMSVGADVSGEARFTAKSGEKGQEGGVGGSFNPNMSVYEITDKGLSAQANWGGTAYVPDTELNPPDTNKQP
jgi:lipid-binding SYLF domain-containing protein